MAPKPTQRYLVVIKPAPPKAPVGVGQAGMTYSTSSFSGPTVKTVMGISHKDAAERADIPAGATAQVVLESDISTFRRPDTAPLIAA